MKSFPSNIGRGLRTALSQISILRLDGASYRCLTGTRPGFFNEVLPICFQPCNAAPTQVKSKRTQSIWLRRLPKGREFGSISLSTFVPLVLGPRSTAKNKQGFLGQFSGWSPASFGVGRPPVSDWSPASSWVGRSPVLGLVATPFLGLVAPSVSGWSPASFRAGRPPARAYITSTNCAIEFTCRTQKEPEHRPGTEHGCPGR